MKKRLLSVLLCIALLCSMTVAALADEPEVPAEEMAEDVVPELPEEKEEEEPAEEEPAEEEPAEEEPTEEEPAEEEPTEEEGVFEPYLPTTGDEVFMINVNAGANGVVTIVEYAAVGETVTYTAVPDKGFTLETMIVSDSEGNAIEVTRNEDGSYSFVMPEGAVNMEVTFMEDNTMLNFCVDVKAKDWFYDDVLYVYEHGLMNGTNAVTFAPKASMNRAMLVTILYRMEGEPAFMNDNVFSDVPAGSYFEKPVVWANGKNIVNGIGGGKFGPGKEITREQFATILYRYAQAKGQGFHGAWMFLLDFADRDEISNYANEAMHWCVMKGIISGMGNRTLNPKGIVNRAQAAAMLRAFNEIMADVDVPAQPIIEDPTIGEPIELVPSYPAVVDPDVPTDDEPEFIFPDYEGTYLMEDGSSIELTANDEGGYDVIVGIYRLSQFEGKATYMDDALEFVLTGPGEGEINATFYPTEEEGVFELIITVSTWEPLEAEIVFTGFVKA